MHVYIYVIKYICIQPTYPGAHVSLINTIDNNIHILYRDIYGFPHSDHRAVKCHVKIAAQLSFIRGCFCKMHFGLQPNVF